MNTKKTINTAVAIFAITIFLLATAPKLFAEYYGIDEGGSKVIYLKNTIEPITITGIYKELIDTTTGKVITKTPITASYDYPILLNPEHEYRINVSFTSSKDISNLAKIGSQMSVLARIDDTYIEPEIYDERNSDIKNLKLSITEGQNYEEKYKYTYTYIINNAHFTKIKNVTDTYNTKPDGYDFSISEWLSFYGDQSSKVYKVNDSFEVDGLLITVNKITGNSMGEGTYFSVDLSISKNGVVLAKENYKSGDTIFPNYLSTPVEISNVYSSRILLLLTNVENVTDFISLNGISIPVEITWSSNVIDADAVTYKLEIPCAIDRTKIILPAKIDPNYTGQYKTLCNSSAYFNQETGVYHLKKNEGYYLNLELTNQDLENPIVSLQFYKENETNPCFVKSLEKSYNEKNKYIGKISYVHPNDSEEFGLENMAGFIESCGLDKPIDIKTIITTLENGAQFSAENIGDIKAIIIDSDNSNIVAENARTTEERTEIYEDKNSEKFRKEIRSIEVINKDVFINKKDSVQKVIPVSQMLEENKIDSKKIVGDINLETTSENPVYVFEVKEQNKFLGIIPFGEKIVEKRISAVKELQE